MNEKKMTVVTRKLTAKEKKEERARQNKIKQEKAREAAQARAQADKQLTPMQRVNQVLGELRGLVKDFEDWVRKIKVSLDYKGMIGPRRCPCGLSMIHNEGHFVGVDSIAINERLGDWRKKIIALENKIAAISPREYEMIGRENLEDFYHKMDAEHVSQFMSEESRRIARDRLGLEYVDDDVHVSEYDHLKTTPHFTQDFKIPEGCRLGRHIPYVSRFDAIRDHGGKMMIRRLWEGEFIGDEKELECHHYVLDYLRSTVPCDCIRDQNGHLPPVKASETVLVDMSYYHAQIEDQREAIRCGLPPFNVRAGNHEYRNRYRLGLEHAMSCEYRPNLSTSSDSTSSSSEDPFPAIH